MSVRHCDERNRLFLEHRTAAERYSAAVTELTRKMGISSFDDYRELHQAAEAARTRSNEARGRVARHVAEHHCETSK